MSFRDLLDTSQAIALADKLAPTEIAVWERYCRDFSMRFSTPLMLVREMDPLFVFQQINADNLNDLEIEERLPDIQEMLASLSDPQYDAKKELAIQEENRQIEEREKERLQKGEAIHKSLEKDKRVVSNNQPSRELPKSGGLNMALINQLANSNKES